MKKNNKALSEKHLLIVDCAFLAALCIGMYYILDAPNVNSSSVVVIGILIGTTLRDFVLGVDSYYGYSKLDSLNEQIDDARESYIEKHNELRIEFDKKDAEVEKHIVDLNKRWETEKQAFEEKKNRLERSVAPLMKKRDRLKKDIIKLEGSKKGQIIQARKEVQQASLTEKQKLFAEIRKEQSELEKSYQIKNASLAGEFDALNKQTASAKETYSEIKENLNKIGQKLEDEKTRFAELMEQDKEKLVKALAESAQKEKDFEIEMDKKRIDYEAYVKECTANVKAEADKNLRDHITETETIFADMQIDGLKKVKATIEERKNVATAKMNEDLEAERKTQYEKMKRFLDENREQELDKLKKEKSELIQKKNDEREAIEKDIEEQVRRSEEHIRNMEELSESKRVSAESQLNNQLQEKVTRVNNQCNEILEKSRKEVSDKKAKIDEAYTNLEKDIVQERFIRMAEIEKKSKELNDQYQFRKKNQKELLEVELENQRKIEKVKIEELQTQQNEMTDYYDVLIEQKKEEIGAYNKELDELFNQIDNFDIEEKLDGLGLRTNNFNNLPKDELLLKVKASHLEQLDFINSGKYWTTINRKVKKGLGIEAQSALETSLYSFNNYVSLLLSQLRTENKDSILRNLKAMFILQNKYLSRYDVELSQDFLRLKADEVEISIEFEGKSL